MREDTTTLNFHLDCKAPITDGLSYHYVSGKHLWIAVNKGSVIVLEDDLQIIFEQLIRGTIPKDIILEAQDQELRLRNLRKLVRKCAEAGFINGFKGYSTTQSSDDARRFARLHVTNRCQLKCIHCYTDAGQKNLESDELSTVEWKAIIKDLAENGCTSIVFTGGEPLFRTDCIELLKQAHDCKIENIGVMTNGLLVSRYIDDLAKYLSSIQIGMDGADEVTNDKVRGRGTFRRIIRALDALSQTHLDVKASIALLEMNWPSIRDNLTELSRRYDKNRIKFKIGKGLLDYGRATSLQDSLDTFPIQPFVGKFNASFYPPARFHVHHELKICGIYSQILIASDGQVYPCHLQHRSLGYIKDKTIREWQDFFEKQWHKYTADHVEGCRDCDLRNLCGGSCKVLDQKRMGSEFVTSCTPDVIEKTYQNLVRIFQ